MKKKILFSMFLLCVFIGTTYSQGNDFLWANSAGGNGSIVFGKSITTDNAGNIYTSGFFVGAADFNPGVGTYNLSAPSGSVFVQKVDPSGNFIWAKKIPGAAYGITAYIDVDDDENVYLSGYFQNTGDFDPGPAIHNLTSNGGSDIFILKLNSSGNFVWAKSIGANGSDIATELTVDNIGNLHITGSHTDTVDFDPGAGIFNLNNSGGGPNVFVLKLDDNGDFVWAKSVNGTHSVGQAIKVDGQGNVYTSGRFESIVDFDPGTGVFNLTSNGYRDVFIQKLDVNGNFVWAKSIGGILTDEVHAISLDASNNVLIFGVFQYTVDFDPGPDNFILSTNNSPSMYVLKLNDNGDFVWAKVILGDLGFTWNGSLVTDSLNNIFLFTTISGSYDLDPGAGSHVVSTSGDYDRDGAMIKLDSIGSFAWGSNFLTEVTTDQGFYDATIDPQGNIISTGYFGATVDFDSGVNDHYLNAIGDVDAFLLKLSPCETSVGIAESNAAHSVIAYPNPTSGNIAIDLEDIKDATIKVLNISGQVVYQQAQVNGIHQFELAAAPGVYTIEVTAESIRKYVKLIKQ